MKYFYFLITGLVLASCQANQKVEISSPTIPLSAEGPIFEGANTAIGTWNVDINDWLKEQKIDSSQIENIKIVSISYLPKQSLTSEKIQEITLQATSKTFDMQKIAFVSPYPKQEKAVPLNIAQEQINLFKLFAAKEITFVADLNINQDMDQNLDMEITVVFEIEYSLK